MNTLMYNHPLTSEHLRVVKEVIGYHVVGPIGKTLACGDIGEGNPPVNQNNAKAVRRSWCNDRVERHCKNRCRSLQPTEACDRVWGFIGFGVGNGWFMFAFVVRLQSPLKRGLHYVIIYLFVIQLHALIVRSVSGNIVSETRAFPSSLHTIPWRTFRRLEIFSK